MPSLSHEALLLLFRKRIRPAKGRVEGSTTCIASVGHPSSYPMCTYILLPIGPSIVTVPSAVITEWWRGRSDARETILDGVRVEPLDERLARLAGEALAAVEGATVVDAVVMASAARRGDIVYTADFADLLRLQAFFPSVRVLAA